MPPGIKNIPAVLFNVKRVIFCRSEKSTLYEYEALHSLPTFNSNVFSICQISVNSPILSKFLCNDAAVPEKATLDLAGCWRPIHNKMNVCLLVPGYAPAAITDQLRSAPGISLVQFQVDPCWRIRTGKVDSDWLLILSPPKGISPTFPPCVCHSSTKFPDLARHLLY